MPLVPLPVPPPMLRNVRKVSVRKTKLRQVNAWAQAKVAQARAWVCRGLATPLDWGRGLMGAQKCYDSGTFLVWERGTRQNKYRPYLSRSGNETIYMQL